jgi:transcriptional regulator with XRE-family HTH domain
VLACVGDAAGYKPIRAPEASRNIVVFPRKLKAPEKLTLPNLRTALGWSRNRLARVMNASDRAIVNWESGNPISPVYAAKLREIQSIYNELKQLIKPEEIGSWLLTDMDEFEGSSPADLISKGETRRLWESLFYPRSGMPD